MVQFNNGFIISPNVLWRPAYRISPYNTSFVKKNQEIISAGKKDQSLLNTFFGERYQPFESGRQAINHALGLFSLQKEDEVWILTTSGNKYISSCVTNEIDKFCKWSRQKTAKTKLIFVNHEFGACYNDLQSLKQHGLPVIEDRAMSFVSQDLKSQTGKVGDVVVYSLPKFFPVSFGGVLQYNNTSLYKKHNTAAELDAYFSILMSHYLKETETIKQQRKKNYSYLKQSFDTIGFNERFAFTENEVPGVFMFKAQGIDLNKLKTFIQGNGIESSVFYDEPAFFIPVHDKLETADLDFFYTLINYFKENGDQ
jgi:hypothetical protein